MNCKKCFAKLLPEARFCHQCGTPLKATKTCSSCNQENPLDALFCHRCGSSMEEDNHQHMEKVSSLFDQFMSREVSQNQGFRFYERILNRYKSERYYSVFSARFDQLELEQKEKQAAFDLNNPALIRAFHSLLEFFLVMYCQDLLPFPLSDRNLRYEGLAPEDIDLQAMAVDYIYLNELDEDIYFNLIDVEFDRLKNASEQFLHMTEEEYFLFMIDLSISGNLKHGFALTDKKLYMKAPLQQAFSIDLMNIREMKMQEQWLIIDGRYVNVNPAFNFRLKHYIQKLVLVQI